MDVIYAAEKPSIAELLAEHIHHGVNPEEIKVIENPDETGSFFIGWGPRRYVLSPSGEILDTPPRHHTPRGGEHAGSK
jgi:hypothetical protein